MPAESEQIIRTTFRNVLKYFFLIYDKSAEIISEKSDSLDAKVRDALDSVELFKTEAAIQLSKFMLNLNNCYQKTTCKACQQLDFDFLGINDERNKKNGFI